MVSIHALSFCSSPLWISWFMTFLTFTAYLSPSAWMRSQTWKTSSLVLRWFPWTSCIYIFLLFIIFPDFVVGTTMKNSIYGELGLCHNLCSAMTCIVSNLTFITLLHGRKIILCILQIRSQPERTSGFCRSQNQNRLCWAPRQSVWLPWAASVAPHFLEE